MILTDLKPFTFTFFTITPTSTFGVNIDEGGSFPGNTWKQILKYVENPSKV